MGYTTDFDGRFELSRALTVPESNELKKFADDRHEGEGYPGYYCQWIPSEDGLGIQWDGNEKFYEYVEWIEYLIKHYFEKWGVKVNGVVRYQGEEIGDVGRIEIKDNVVEEIELDATGVVECPACGHKFRPEG